MYIEKVANFGVAMATLGHNIDPSLTITPHGQATSNAIFLGAIN
jgi:hypothetical protein